MKNNKRRLFILFLVLFSILGSFATAQETGTAPDADASKAVESEETAEAGEAEGRSPLATGLIAIASALAIGITAVGTGIAQSRIGSAGAGTIAERPESASTIIILIAIPETMVILGFIVSVIMLFTL